MTVEFSLTRTRATWKPRVTEVDLPFFQTETGTTLLGVSGLTEAFTSGTGRSLVHELPYSTLEAMGGNLPEPAPLLSRADLPEGVHIDYRIDGGFNNNVVKVTWDIDRGVDCRIEWVALKTFTGFQLKYVTPKKRSPLVFALADEDAFQYCNKAPCEECTFKCKLGFVAYVKVSDLGIVRMPLERVSLLPMSREKNERDGS